MTASSNLPPNSLAGLYVLIAEDEPLLAYELVEELERLGAQPIGPLTSIDEALEYLESGELLHAALVNGSLKGISSDSLADALIARSVPFMFVSKSDDQVAERYPDVPSHPRLDDLPDIIEALRLLLERPESI